MTKGELMAILAEFNDDDLILIFDQDLYEFYVDPIHMGFDKEGNDRGSQIHLNIIRNEE